MHFGSQFFTFVEHRSDCIKIWEQHQDLLQERAKKLTQLKIEQLHFIGPGTDLKVFLSPQAIFKGGGDKTIHGISFEANIPTEECFTTPDYRRTEGKVRTTPFCSCQWNVSEGFGA